MAVISQQLIAMPEKKKENNNIILNIQHFYWTDKFTIGRKPKISATTHSIAYITMISIIFW